MDLEYLRRLGSRSTSLPILTDPPRTGGQECDSISRSGQGKVSQYVALIDPTSVDIPHRFTSESTCYCHARCVFRSALSIVVVTPIIGSLKRPSISSRIGVKLHRLMHSAPIEKPSGVRLNSAYELTVSCGGIRWLAKRRSPSTRVIAQK